ncbi:Uncharacterised protein [Bordetella pertussis]|nr:Uncharacterised protein [Bordetella pertussis]
MANGASTMNISTERQPVSDEASQTSAAAPRGSGHAST